MTGRKRLFAWTVVVFAIAAPLMTLIVAPSFSWNPNAPWLQSDSLIAVSFIDQRSHPFGAPVRAEIIVFADRTEVVAESIRIQADFVPYRPTGVPTVVRFVVGDTVVVRYRVQLQCIDVSACLPSGESMRFPSASVHYQEMESERELKRSKLVPWLSVTPLTQLTQEDAQQLTPREGSSFPLLPSWRVAPLVLGWALLVVSCVGFLLVAVLVRRELMHVTTSLPALPGADSLQEAKSPLERAMHRITQSLTGEDLRERRSALEELAEILEEHSSSEIAYETRSIAWSRSEPDIEKMRELLERVAHMIARGGV